MNVYVDDGQIMFGSRIEFIAKRARISTVSKTVNPLTLSRQNWAGHCRIQKGNVIVGELSKFTYTSYGFELGLIPPYKSCYNFN